VTCDRVIELRNTDINRPKSTTAVRAVTAMNPAFHAVAYESKVRVRVCLIFPCSCNVQK
jgi:molybdopterin/thiamine biosynthesis adenylyltransferase